MQVDGSKKLSTQVEIDLQQVAAQIQEDAVSVEATNAFLKQMESSIARVDKLSRDVKKIESAHCIQWTLGGVATAIGLVSLIAKVVGYWQNKKY